MSAASQDSRSIERTRADCPSKCTLPQRPNSVEWHVNTVRRPICFACTIVFPASQSCAWMTSKL
eukprot:3378339-Rhodomonas_salina.2